MGLGKGVMSIMAESAGEGSAEADIGEYALAMSYDREVCRLKYEVRGDKEPFSIGWRCWLDASNAARRSTRRELTGEEGSEEIGCISR